VAREKGRSTKDEHIKMDHARKDKKGQERTRYGMKVYKKTLM